MGKYYFDIQDGDRAEIDSSGAEFRDLSAAKEEAVKAVTELGRDVLRAKEKERLTVIIRDESGPALEVAAAFRVRSLRS